jgi:hypothetical protein
MLPWPMRCISSRVLAPLAARELSQVSRHRVDEHRRRSDDPHAGRRLRWASDPPPVSELGELSRDPDPSRIQVQIAASDGHELTPPEWLRWQPKPSVSLAVETLAPKAPRELAGCRIGVCSDEKFLDRGRVTAFP